MKTIIKLSFLFLAVALIACQKEDSEPGLPNDFITISNGMIQSPKWLVDEVNRVADQYSPSPATGDKHYPWVYSLKYNGQDYIFIMDMLSSIVGNYYFTLSGDYVDPELSIGSDLFNNLEEARRKNGVLLWRQLTKNESTSTRAFISPAYIYTPNGSFVPEAWMRSEEWSSADKQALLKSCTPRISSCHDFS